MTGRIAAAAAIVFVLGAPAWSQIPAGPDFGVNAYTTDIQQDAVVAADAAGNFVVMWSHFGGLDGSLGGVFGRRYDPSGATVGPESFQVNAYTTGNQRTPAVAADQGRIVAVWQSYGQDGAGWGVFGRRFDAPAASAGRNSRSTPTRRATSGGQGWAWTPAGTSWWCGRAPRMATATGSSASGSTRPGWPRGRNSGSTA